MAEPPEHREAFVRAGVPMVTRLFSLGFLIPGGLETSADEG